MPPALPRHEHLGTTALILCAALLLPAVAGWGESESGLAGGISLLALNVGSDAPRVMTASGTVFSEDRCALCPGPFMHKMFHRTTSEARASAATHFCPPLLLTACPPAQVLQQGNAIR